MFPAIGILLLAVPIIELVVILYVGSAIGYLETLGLLILISVAGALLLKREGTAAWRRLQAALERGEMPTDEATDGALILFGGAMLLTPGFVTDLVGLLLLLPMTRAGMKRILRRTLGAMAMRRAGVAGQTGRRIYDARVTRVRPGERPTSGPERLPYVPPPRGDEDDSRDTG